jgi:hypothetical protein
MQGEPEESDCFDHRIVAPLSQGPMSLRVVEPARGRRRLPGMRAVGFQDMGPCRGALRRIPSGVRAAQKGEVGVGRRRGNFPVLPAASPTSSPPSFVTVSIS